MTTNQKQKIQQMRQNGQSYLQVASTLGISENTIKSYCRRNNVGTAKSSGPQAVREIHTSCMHCGKPLTHGTMGQPKKFCSDKAAVHGGKPMTASL